MIGLEIAVIGIGCRFPEAADPHSFWRLLKEGREGISFFTAEELIAIGVPAKVANDPSYVRARAVLDGIEMFDAAFFGFTPEEAKLTDPQQRIFLECAWEAMEDAGYDPARYPGGIGVYAGAITSQYLFHMYLSGYSGDLIRSRHAIIGNENDHLPARVAYKLNLKGPAVDVQTACSTSLVAIHMACQGLLSGDCDMALAGGASVGVPQKIGHLYQQGGIESRDGHCRAFDADASGIVSGSGVGVVLLKRLSEAVEDRDQIYAVIKGSAINNDGAQKVGYTAPSVEGQVQAIRTAQLRAETEPDSISYVEAHGTGTELGDPIEIAALSQAFSAGTSRKQYCAIGSLKTNIGHLDAAAGVGGFIKTALALRHELIPPSLHFKKPNPKIDFANSPFFVASSPLAWERVSGKPRRAAVSSFGIGGTNAHVVLEEAPAPSGSSAGRGLPILVLSARSSSALQQARERLLEFLCARPEAPLYDIAYTLQVGRRHFPHRLTAVCVGVSDAIEKLRGERVECNVADSQPKVAFMFPGQAAQSANMGRALYDTYPEFRRQVDDCCAMLQPHLKLDLKTILFPPAGNEDQAEKQLLETSLTQPVMFVIEYALARLWIEWGIQPAAVIGHSVGEYVAACIAGVMPLEEALRAIMVRARLMQKALPGAMLAVGLSPEELEPMLRGDLALAAVNSSSLCVAAGPVLEIEELERMLARRSGTYVKRLKTNRAFHSPMMDGILDEFVSSMKTVRLGAPAIPCISGTTGGWMTDEARTPEYWGQQLRRTVMFAKGIKTVRELGCNVFLEAGPGATLARLATMNLKEEDDNVQVFPSLASTTSQLPEIEALHQTLAALWLTAAPVAWEKYHAGEARSRVGLPTYPFERSRYWLENQRAIGTARAMTSSTVPADAMDLDVKSIPDAGETHYAAENVTTILQQQVSIMQQQLDYWMQIKQ